MPWHRSAKQPEYADDGEERGDGEYAWAAWVRKWSYSVSVIRTDTARYKIYMWASTVTARPATGHSPHVDQIRVYVGGGGPHSTCTYSPCMYCIASSGPPGSVAPVQTPEQDASRSTGATRGAPRAPAHACTVVYGVANSPGQVTISVTV